MAHMCHDQIQTGQTTRFSTECSKPMFDCNCPAAGHTTSQAADPTQTLAHGGWDWGGRVWEAQSSFKLQQFLCSRGYAMDNLDEAQRIHPS